jgi:hypothetical protein
MASGISYTPMLWSALIFSAIAIAIGIYPLYNTNLAKNKEIFKTVRKIASLLFYLLGKALSGPFFGLGVSIIYCDANTPYHSGNTCYTPEHIFNCIIAVLLVLMVIYSVLGVSFVFFSRSPFEGNCYGHPNRNYMISKSILKIVLPLFFALNGSFNLDFLYIFASPALWGVYIFFHRLNSYHTFNHKNFYFEFFL